MAGRSDTVCTTLSMSIPAWATPECLEERLGVDGP
jgi:hypothetical protein